jgi:glycerol-3-phosphate dehydrogenase (NAD(P)+)
MGPFKSVRADSRGGLTTEKQRERIGIVGSGGFGTVLAKMMAEKGLTVYQWVRDQELAGQMESERENRKYLPGVKLPENLWFSGDLRTVVEDATIIIAAVPSFAQRQVAKQYAPYVGEHHVVVNLAKGLEEGTLLRMSQVLRDELPEETAVASLSGPNLAEELAKDMPAGAIVAADMKPCLPRLTRTLDTKTFKVYASHDLIGVELGGLLKNITALAAGVSDGIGYGDNTKASLITLGLYEMFTVGANMGAKRETFFGLAGIGDLVATCSSTLSRNHTVGEMLGKGVALDEAIKRLEGRVAEGVRTTKFVHEFAQRENLTLPLTNQMFQVLYEDKDVHRALEDLLENV